MLVFLDKMVFCAARAALQRSWSRRVKDSRKLTSQSLPVAAWVSSAAKPTVCSFSHCKMTSERFPSSVLPGRRLPVRQLPVPGDAGVQTRREDSPRHQHAGGRLRSRRRRLSSPHSCFHKVSAKVTQSTFRDGICKSASSTWGRIRSEVCSDPYGSMEAGSKPSVSLYLYETLNPIFTHSSCM